MSVVVQRRLIDASLVTSLVFVSIGSGLFLPLSLVFFAELTTIPLAALGAIVGLSGLLALPVPLLVGRLADRYGARRLVMVAQAAQAIAFVGYMLARGPLDVFLVSALMALGGRMFWSTIFAALADHAEAEGKGRQQRWFAIANTARTAGIAAGGLITGIALTIPGDATYLTLALCAACCLAISVGLMLPVSRHRSSAASRAQRRQGLVFRDAQFMALLSINSVFAISTLLLGLTIPVVIKAALGGPGWLTSLLLVGNAVLVSIFGVFGARRASAHSPFRVLGVSALAWAAGCAFLAVAAAVALPSAAGVLALAVIAFSLAEVLHAPTSMAVVSDMAPAAARGNYLAVFQYSFMAAEIVGPILFTGLFVANPSAPFVAVLLLNLVAIPALAVLGRRMSTAQES
ncbi:MFS transporter [Humibacter sp. RRB41]|uniref:MFS transporter n=1 Tax=Humibacter sp. RRB41 TaxID=2919946 RepID=UPI001FA975AC|nr:MFS transporter [Humibacter sp. RRB41]